MTTVFWQACLFVLFAVLRTYSKPIEIAKLAYSTQSGGGFFNRNFGWAANWGGESEVSVVDRNPSVSWSSRPAAFGPEINSPILGYVIPLNSFTVGADASSVPIHGDNTGCPPLTIPGPVSPDPKESWIALVQRGSCEFVAKVREAQRLGARAVVVGGLHPSFGIPDTLLNMYSQEDSSDIHIPSTYITYASYETLIDLIDHSNTSHDGLRTLSLLITAQYNSWEWYSPIVTFVTILFLPSLLTFITLFVHRMRMIQRAQRERAPEDVVRALESRIWVGVEKKDENETDQDVAASTSQPSHPTPWFENQLDCAICLSEFVKGDKIRVLPCRHIFHMEEVDEWLVKRKKLCPVCKKDVTLPAEPAGTPATVARNDGIPNYNAVFVSDTPSPSGTATSSATETTPLLAPSRSSSAEPV